jgi:hypothetical protein
VAIPTAELHRRVQVTATKSWGPTLTELVGEGVDYQVAAPSETRTPDWHRANIAHQRVRMEGWRQRRLGSKEDHSTTKGNYKTDLTLTGLLMEGLGLARHPSTHSYSCP